MMFQNCDDSAIHAEDILSVFSDYQVFLFGSVYPAIIEVVENILLDAFGAGIESLLYPFVRMYGVFDLQALGHSSQIPFVFFASFLRNDFLLGRFLHFEILLRKYVHKLDG